MTGCHDTLNVGVMTPTVSIREKTCRCNADQACWSCLRFTSYLDVARAEIARRRMSTHLRRVS